jgi:hypothetical protein
MDVNLTIVVMLAATLALATAGTDRGAALTGALFALLILQRATFGLTLVAACAWLAWRGRGRAAAVMFVTATAAMAPWLARNAAVDGSLLPTRVGENLLLSTSEYAEPMVPVSDVDPLVPLVYAEAVASLPEGHSASQRSIDHAMLMRALRFVRDHPVRAAWLKIRNAVYLFDPRILPRHPAGPETTVVVRDGKVALKDPRSRSRAQELAQAIAQALVLVSAAAALVRRGVTPRDEPVLLVAATQALVCVAFFPATRLLAPAFTLLFVYAGIGLTMAARRFAAS